MVLMGEADGVRVTRSRAVQLYSVTSRCAGARGRRGAQYRSVVQFVLVTSQIAKLIPSCRFDKVQSVRVGSSSCAAVKAQIRTRIRGAEVFTYL
jgi:hypothetical protein